MIVYWFHKHSNLYLLFIILFFRYSIEGPGDWQGRGGWEGSLNGAFSAVGFGHYSGSRCCPATPSWGIRIVPPRPLVVGSRFALVFITASPPLLPLLSPTPRPVSPDGGPPSNSRAHGFTTVRGIGPSSIDPLPWSTVFASLALGAGSSFFDLMVKVQVLTVEQSKIRVGLIVF